MKNISRIAVFVLCAFVFHSCQNDTESVSGFTSEVNLLKSSIDFSKLKDDFGKPDFDNMIKQENEEYNLVVYGVPFFTPDFKQSVLYATVIDGKFMDGYTFIADIESSDQNFTFEYDSDSFKGVFKTFNLEGNQPLFSKNINTNVENEISKDDCFRGSPSAGYSICSADQVGNCVGYKMCSMGFFETAACYASFPICMGALALDCQTELCWDSDPSNNYLY